MCKFGKIIIKRGIIYRVDHGVLFSATEGVFFSFINALFDISLPKKLVIPEGVVQITSNFLGDVENIRKVEIPSSVTNIGDSSFRGNCIKKVIINIGKQLKIDSGAFQSCGIKELVFKTHNKNAEILLYPSCFASNDIKTLDIPEGVKEISSNAFENCRNLSSIVLPSTLRQLSYSCFRDCCSMRTIKCRGKLKNVWIGGSVFDDFYEVKHAQELLDKAEDIKDGNKSFKAYKAFRITPSGHLVCRDFDYGKANKYSGRIFEMDEMPILCDTGFHACLIPIDCFSYYNEATYDSKLVIYEVEVLGSVDFDGYLIGNFDTKICTNKIKIGKRLSLNEVFEISNNMSK